MTVLLREAIGDRLRHARTTKRRTLRDVSRVARVSLGYLSEVERGRKEPSSELLAAICDALDLPLYELLGLVAADVRAVDEVAAAPAAPVPAGQGAEGKGGTRPAESSIQGGRMVSARVGNDLSDLRLQPMLSHRLSKPIGPRDGGSVYAAA
ncbi:MAG TPA: helix-turn-helix transcriptional regulator [Pseudonocardiaceae bacterium]|nr:helix-turn-helix transcriptional regulator [Pseudonocardiaceae bacterium]